MKIKTKHPSDKLGNRYRVRVGSCDGCPKRHGVTYSERRRGIEDPGRYLCWTCHDAMLARLVGA